MPKLRESVQGIEFLDTYPNNTEGPFIIGSSICHGLARTLKCQKYVSISGGTIIKKGKKNMEGILNFVKQKGFKKLIIWMGSNDLYGYGYKIKNSKEVVSKLKKIANSLKDSEIKILGFLPRFKKQEYKSNSTRQALANTYKINLGLQKILKQRFLNPYFLCKNIPLKELHGYFQDGVHPDCRFYEKLAGFFGSDLAFLQ